MPSEIVVAGAAEGRVFSAVGDVYRLLAGGEQTGGAYALFEARVGPGGGPPPHLHTREEESFFILAGSVTVWVADRKVDAGVGAFVQIPRGTVHAFKNETLMEARMLILTSPSGFDRFMEAFGHPLPSFDSPPLPVTHEDIAKLIELAPEYGIEIRLPH